MINIGIVGCGHWALKIINEINNNKKFNLTSIVCRNKNSNFKTLKVFDTVEKMINANIIDCIYVAAEPKLNLETEASESKACGSSLPAPPCGPLPF